jgi:hypothetical protein
VPHAPCCCTAVCFVFFLSHPTTIHKKTHTRTTHKKTTKNNQGAANAGIPLAIIVKDFGWGSYFTTLVGACGVALLLLSPMTNLRSYVQRVEARAERRRLKGE